MANPVISGRKLPLMLVFVLIVAVGGVFVFRYYKSNAPVFRRPYSDANVYGGTVSGKPCGGWNSYGETVCLCQGRYTEEQCPKNALCDARSYYCEGLCGECKCYMGSEKDGKEVLCPNKP